MAGGEGNAKEARAGTGGLQKYFWLIMLGLFAVLYAGPRWGWDRVFLYGLILACPLMHILMMRGHGHGRGHDGAGHRPGQAGRCHGSPMEGDSVTPAHGRDTAEESEGAGRRAGSGLS